MNKSIYDEALEIVTEALEQLDKSVIIKHTGLNELKKVIETAKKQEKLLEQIKDITNKPYNFYIVSMLEVLERYDEIVKLIKEIEDE